MMITPARGREGFYRLQEDDGRENCAPPRSGLVQLLLLRTRTRLFAAGAIVLLGIAGEEAYSHVGHWRVIYAVRYLQMFTGIQIGCMLALVRSHSAWMATRQASWLRHWTIPLFAIPISILYNFAPIGTVFRAGVESTCYALILNYLLECPTSIAGSILSFAPIAYLGRLSYSIYLWQQMFCWADPLLHRRWYETFPADILLSVALAMASYHFVERPMLRLRDRLHSPLKPRRILQPMALIAEGP